MVQVAGRCLRNLTRLFLYKNKKDINTCKVNALLKNENKNRANLQSKFKKAFAPKYLLRPFQIVAKIVPGALSGGLK